MNKILLLLLSEILILNISYSQNKTLKPFISVGSSGVGVGVNYKDYNLYTVSGDARYAGNSSCFSVAAFFIPTTLCI
jgi:hypothetical protein